MTLLFSPLVNLHREVVRGLDSKQSSPYDGKSPRCASGWKLNEEITSPNTSTLATPTKAPRTRFVSPLTPPPNHADNVILGATLGVQ